MHVYCTLGLSSGRSVHQVVELTTAAAAVPSLPSLLVHVSLGPNLPHDTSTIPVKKKTKSGRKTVCTGRSFLSLPPQWPAVTIPLQYTHSGCCCQEAYKTCGRIHPHLAAPISQVLDSTITTRESPSQPFFSFLSHALPAHATDLPESPRSPRWCAELAKEDFEVGPPLWFWWWWWYDEEEVVVVPDWPLITGAGRGRDLTVDEG